MQQTTQLDESSDYRTARNIREKRRVQASALMPGFLLVVIGLWALLAIANDAPPALWQVAGLLAITLGVSFIARFLIYERDAPGLIFLGMVVTLAAAAVAGAWYFLAEAASLPALWPVGLVVVGLALILTLLLSARRDRRLLLPGLSFITAGVVALPFTLGMVPPALVDLIATYWPLLFALVGLAALLGVLRRRAEAPEPSPENP
ncbi:MAG: hypothetical protein Kow00120_01290 [Anaerolineae bacterium]